MFSLYNFRKDQTEIPPPTVHLLLCYLLLQKPLLIPQQRSGFHKYTPFYFSIMDTTVKQPAMVSIHKSHLCGNVFANLFRRDAHMSKYEHV
jgi:hypothetical protein